MEINILIGNISDKDKELFFSPVNGDKFVKLDNSATWADILVPAVFKSRSQCRKAGFIEIDEGFTDILVGKKRVRVTILKERSI